MTAIIKLIKKLLKKSRGQQSTAHADYIIPRNQHIISKTNISTNALKVLNRLISSGYEAYLVGGSVRDLLLKKVPKDFDIATNATPNQVKQLFRNARIIGRRFKLVHIIYYRDIIEVATFRGHEPSDDNHKTNERGMIIRDNVYGKVDEDAWRRDFTINSLYYNIKDGSLLDFTGGVKDVQDHLIRIIGDADARYLEDPVRMLRAIRFSAKLHFNIEDNTGNSILQLNHLILNVSSSRLFDEMIKLYQCGEAERAHRLLVKYGLFQQLFEQTHQLLDGQYPINALLGNALESTDVRIRDDKPVNPAFLFAILLWFPLRNMMTNLQIEQQLHPLVALELAMNQVLATQNKVIAIPKRYSQVMREIWLLQFRFAKRQGKRAQNLLHHPRFRAAYDFLALRALAADEEMELANWWTTFQDCSEDLQARMVADLAPVTNGKKPRKRRKTEK